VPIPDSTLGGIIFQSLSYDSVSGSEGVAFRAKGGGRSLHSGKSHAFGTMMYPLPCCLSCPRQFGAERCLAERRGVTLVGGNMGAEIGDCAREERAGDGCVVNCSLIDGISLVGDIGGSLVMDIGEEFGGWRGGELDKPGAVRSSGGVAGSRGCASLDDDSGSDPGEVGGGDGARVLTIGCGVVGNVVVGVAELEAEECRWFRP
jgi:hypothetical protein